MRSLLLTLFLARAAAGAAFIVPVATAKYHDRFYSTTLFLQNSRSTIVRCESVYAIPNNPGTLRATYEIAPRTTQIEEAVLQEAGAIGTLRIECTDEILVAARIQTSTDGKFFDDGRIFPGAAERDPIRADAPRRIATRRDLVVMEVGGEPVQVQATVRDAHGNVVGARAYEIPAFAQQIVNLSQQRATAGTVEIAVHGKGAVIAQPEGDPAAIRLIAQSSQPQPRTVLSARAGNPLAGLPVSFKGAPFQDPATGLIQLRHLARSGRVP